MEIAEVEKKIEDACQEMIQSGKTIRPRSWGLTMSVQNHSFRIGGPTCCPMGALLAVSDMDFHISYLESAARALGIDHNDISLFIEGYDSDLNCDDTDKFFVLGRKFRKKYGSQQDD